MLGQRVALGIVITALFSLPGLQAFADEKADQILKKVEQQVSANDESARIQMTIVDASGSSKVREIEIRRKVKDGAQKVMVKLKSPPDLRGTALLSNSKKDEADEQWLYLPSSKQTRRILSGNKKSNFLDSELSYEDMGTSSDKKFSNVVLKNEAGQTVIESKLVSGESAYSKMITWVDDKTDLASKIEYYDHDGKLLKECDMSQYKKYGSIYRAQTVLVTNVQNHRSTQLNLKDLKLNSGLKDSDFSQTAMAEE